MGMIHTPPGDERRGGGGEEEDASMSVCISLHAGKGLLACCLFFFVRHNVSILESDQNIHRDRCWCAGLGWAGLDCFVDELIVNHEPKYSEYIGWLLAFLAVESTIGLRVWMLSVRKWFSSSNLTSHLIELMNGYYFFQRWASWRNFYLRLTFCSILLILLACAIERFASMYSFLRLFSWMILLLMLSKESAFSLSAGGKGRHY